MQLGALFSWPIIIIFIVIILLAACIVCVAVQDSRGSQPRAYERAGPRQPWRPVQKTPVSKQPWEPSEHQVDVVVCSCGKWNTPKDTTCWNCQTSLAGVQPQTFTFETAQQCAVCSFWVYPGEQVVLCPSCHAQGHRAHMLEFLKAKGTCPVCHIRLGSQQLLNTIPIVGSAQESSDSEETPAN
jgi:hypothetical protein